MAVICQLAARAYKAHAPAIGDMSLNDWRHAEVYQAVGHDSLRQCGQRDYIPLVNHFRRYLNLTPMSDHTPDDHARAAWLVTDAVRRYELADAYVGAIIADQFGVDARGVSLAEMLGYLQPYQLRQLLYTVVNRGRAKVRQTSRDLDIPVPAEHHASRSTLPPGYLIEYFDARS